MINPGVVAVIRVVGVRGDPCGAMLWSVCIAPQGSPRTHTTHIAATTYWRLHPLGLESYWNIHGSSLVMTLVKMFISFQFIQQGQ